MDYHLNKFEDCSYIFLKKNKIIAIIPGNVENHVYYSHKGLTYGGFITSNLVTITDMEILFKLLINELQSLEVTELVYKPVPYIYHNQPSQEDIFTLFNIGATKKVCNISSVIFQNRKIRFSELRRRCVKKALKSGVSICETDQFGSFWKILNENLFIKYSTVPVHTLEEITSLKENFPENIVLYLGYIKDEPVAGVVLFISASVVRAQYISSNEKGKKAGALDLIFDFLINTTYKDIPYFDFGSSKLRSGIFINDKLVFQKEGFGARGVVYETYSYCL
jgi:hypothetical protein